MKVYGNINMQGNAEIVNIVVVSGTSDPVSPAAGELFFRSDLGFLRFYNGSGWISVGNTGVTSLAGTTNQITVSTSTGAVTLSLPSSVTITTGLTVSGLTAKAFLYSGTAGLLTSTSTPTNGQLLIGSTGADPIVGSITGGTGLSVTPGAGTIALANTGVTSIVAGTGVTISGATGAVTINAAGAGTGTVTSVAATGSTGLVVGGSPITTSGTLTFTLGTELQGLSGLAANGFVQRTGAGTYTTRTIPYYFETTGASLSGSALTVTGLNIQPKSGTQSFIQVYVNGIFQQEGATKQYTVTTSGASGVITFNLGAVPVSTDDIVVFAYA